MKTHLILGMALLILGACGEASSDYTEAQNEAYSEREVPITAKAETVSTEPHQPSQKLIKTGHLTFEVSDLAKTHEFLQDELKKYNGYLERDEEAQGYNRIVHNLVVRIPAKSFDLFLASLSNEVNHFDEKTIDVRDVTEQFVDLEARLNAKKELESRYLALLTKANNVDDLLRVEKELNAVRTEIEAMEGRFRVLKNQISYSTLTIQYYTTETAQAEGFSSKLGHEFVNGWDGTLRFLLGVVSIWPFLLFLAAIGIYVRIRLKKRRATA